MTSLLSSSQQLGIVVAQKCSSSLSILGSTYILQQVLRDPRKRGKVFYRLLLALSLSDVICSAWFFIGTWAVPQGTPGVRNPLGTEATCRTQAFFIYASIIPLNFNACLALYYLLSIRYGWKEDRIRKNVEPFFYLFAIGMGVAGGLFGLISDVFGPANFWCSIQPSERTKNTWLIWYVPAWIVSGFVTGAMIAVYVHVLGIERRAESHTFRSMILKHSARDLGISSGSTERSGSQFLQDGNISNSRKERKRQQSQKVAVQALYYCLAFYLTLAFPTVVRAMQALGAQPPYPLKLLHMIFLPLQGFMNFLVYKRVRWSDKLKGYRGFKRFCCKSSRRQGMQSIAAANFSADNGGASGSNQEILDDDDNSSDFDEEEDHDEERKNNQRDDEEAPSGVRVEDTVLSADVEAESDEEKDKKQHDEEAPTSSVGVEVDVLAEDVEAPTSCNTPAEAP